MSSITTKQFIVSGRVQGVGYRWFVINQAKHLHLVGWVRNLSNGSVELCAQGDLVQIDALETALWAGPTMSRIHKVLRTDIVAEENFDSFSVRY